MNSLVTLFSLFSLFFSTSAQCPVGTVASLTDPTICYLLNSTKKAFLIAEQICTQNGGHLVSIHSMFENVFINEEAQELFVESTESNFWIGLTDLQTPEIWKWIDGSPLDFVDWDKGQPDNIPGHDCGATQLSGGKWTTDTCDSQKPFVCQITSTPEPVTTTTKPNKCSDTWTFFEPTNSCYKILQDLSWEDAEHACFTEGSHLASIHSSEENNFIANLIPFKQQCNNANLAWIGLYTIDGQKSWIWTDDSQLNFTLWTTKPPAHDSWYFCICIVNGISCGVALGSWTDGDCRAAVGFSVCKKAAQY